MRRVSRRSRWRRHRALRILAIAVLTLTGGVAILEERHAQRGAASAAAPIAIARHALPSGAVLEAGDLATTLVPRDSPLLAVAVDPGDAVGRRTADPLAAGEMLTPGRLRGTTDTPPGTTVMPVAFPDSDVAAYLEPGTVLDILWTPDDFTDASPRIVAQNCVVVRAGPPQASTPTASWGTSPVLLQVPDADTVALAQALGSGRLSVLLRSP